MSETVKNAIAFYNEKMTDEALREANPNFEILLPEGMGASNWRDAVNEGIPQCCEMHFISASTEIMDTIALIRGLCMASGCDDNTTHDFLQHLVDSIHGMINKAVVDTVSGN